MGRHCDKNKKVTLKLSKKARKAFKKKLSSGKKVKVKVTVTPALGDELPADANTAGQ